SETFHLSRGSTVQGFMEAFELASSRPRHQLAAYRTAAHAQSAVQDPCDCYFPRSPERRRKFPGLTNLKRSCCFCLMPLSYPDSQLPRPSGSRRGGGIGVPPNWLGRNRAAAPTKAASVTHHATVNPLGNPALIACSRRCAPSVIQCQPTLPRMSDRM